MIAPKILRKTTKIEVLFKTKPDSNDLGTFKIDYTGTNLNLKVQPPFLFITYSDDLTKDFTTKVLKLNEIDSFKEYFETHPSVKN
jgi:hypothetical protein